MAALMEAMSLVTSLPFMYRLILRVYVVAKAFDFIQRWGKGGAGERTAKKEARRVRGERKD